MGALKSSRCARGHRWTEKNTLVLPSGRRECRACKRLRYELAKAKRKLEKQTNAVAA